MNANLQPGDQVVVNCEHSFRYGHYCTVIETSPRPGNPSGDLVLVKWNDLRMTSTYATKNLTPLTAWLNAGNKIQN